MDMVFDHVAQQVPDVGAAISWYQRIVPGCHVLYQDETWALVEAGGLKLAFIAQQQHPTHVAWRVAPAALETLAAQLGQTICTHRDNSRSIYIEAPGGHWVEFIAYRERSEEAGR